MKLFTLSLSSCSSSVKVIFGVICLWAKGKGYSENKPLLFPVSLSVWCVLQYFPLSVYKEKLLMQTVNKIQCWNHNTLKSFNMSFHFTDAPEGAWMIMFSKPSVLDEHTARASVWPNRKQRKACRLAVSSLCCLIYSDTAGDHFRGIHRRQVSPAGF